MSEEAFLAELRSELVAAAQRRHSDMPATTSRRARNPRSLPLRLVAASMTLLVAVAAVVVMRTGDAHAAVEVIRADGFVHVRLVDLETRPEEIVAAARDAGVDLTVSAVPVGPSMVGRFISLTATELPPEMIPTDDGAVGSTTHYTSFRVPEGFGGELRVHLGRQARPGEEWIAASDALAPGELLECQDLLGKRVEELRGHVEGLDATVRWFAISPNDSSEVMGDLDPYASWRAVRILGAGDGIVFIEVTPDGSWPYMAQPRPSTSEGC